MHDLLDNQNIVQRIPALNKTTLLPTDKIRQHPLQPISKDLKNNFIADITKGDRTIINHSFRIVIFRIRVMWYGSKIWAHLASIKKVLDSIEETISNLMPKKFVKVCVKAI